MNALLRIVSHPKNNKHHIDKMIYIKSIPEKLFFNQRNGKNFMKEFVEVDITDNVPDSIQAKFSHPDEKVYRYVPPAEKNMAGFDQEFPLIGLVLDYQNRNGAEVWNSIERMIDARTPRDQRMEEPVVIAVDHRSDFKRDLVIPTVDLDPNTESDVFVPARRMGRPKKEVTAA